MSPATNSWPMWIIEASGSYPGLSEPLLGVCNHTPVCNIIRPPLCWSFACSAAFYHIQHHTLNQSRIISSADVAKRRPDLCERKLLYWIRIGPVSQTVIGIAIIIVWVGSEEDQNVDARCRLIRMTLLHCVLSLATQCIVIGPVCVCVFVGLLLR